MPGVFGLIADPWPAVAPPLGSRSVRSYDNYLNYIRQIGGIAIDLWINSRLHNKKSSLISYFNHLVIPYLSQATWIYPNSFISINFQFNIKRFTLLFYLLTFPRQYGPNILPHPLAAGMKQQPLATYGLCHHFLPCVCLSLPPILLCGSF